MKTKSSNRNRSRTTKKWWEKIEPCFGRCGDQDCNKDTNGKPIPDWIIGLKKTEYANRKTSSKAKLDN